MRGSCPALLNELLISQSIAASVRESEKNNKPLLQRCLISNITLTGNKRKECGSPPLGCNKRTSNWPKWTTECIAQRAQVVRENVLDCKQLRAAAQPAALATKIIQQFPLLFNLT